MLAIGNDELGRPLRLTERCPKCEKEHYVETASVLHFLRCEGTSYLIGVKGKLISFPKKTAEPAMDKESLGSQVAKSANWDWRDGMLVLRWSVGKPDHLVPEGRVGSVDRRFITPSSIPDLEDAPTRGALLGLLRELIGDSTLSPTAYRSDEGMVLWRFGSALGAVSNWVKQLQDAKSEAELLVRALILVEET